MKKLLIIFTIMISFLFITSIFIVGIGNYSINGINIIPKFLFKSKDIVFNKSNGGGTDIKVYITKDKKIINISLEEYVRGVVAGEMPAEFGPEALKAQAVAARTYAAAHMEAYGGKRYNGGNDADVSDTSQCQIYMTKVERFKGWPSNSNKQEIYWNKITAAVQSTLGQVLTYNNKLIMNPWYFAISSGKTENASEVFNFSEPYLQSVSSPGEQIAKQYKSTVQFTINNFIIKVNSSYPKANLKSKNIKNQVAIDKNRTEGGSVVKIKLGSISLTGSEFRTLLGLNSSNFTLNVSSSKIIINCLGYGHDIGMSQWGANVMSTSGKSYTDILYHYYQGVKLDKLTSLNLLK